MDSGPPYTDEQLEQKMSEPQLRKALEYLRTRGSAREAYHELLKVLPTIADEIAHALPGVTWEWRDPTLTADSGANSIVSGDTYGSSWSTTLVLFKVTFTDDMWHTAVGIVEKYAHTMGATEQFTLPVADDIRFHNPTTDILLDIGRGNDPQERLVSLESETGLHLRQDIYDGKTTIDQAIGGVMPKYELP